MERALYQKLLDWKKNVHRKPLILYGARQVGKTYLLSEFGKNEFDSVHYINFERDPNAVSIFAEDISPKRLIPLLELYLESRIDKQGNDLIFLDEIQECPRAVTSLKYFNEQMPHQAVCCAGSFIGLIGNETSFPVGKVDTLTLFPMSYQEFLASKSPELCRFYRSFLETTEPLPHYVHGKLWNALLLYYFVGGMPEAVKIVDDTDTISGEKRDAIAAIQSNLITGFRSDFAKRSGIINAHHLNRLFDSIPMQLPKETDGNAGRFKFKGVLPNSHRYRDLAGVIDWLEAAGLIYRSHIIDVPLSPLKTHIKESIFKLYLFDIGLLHRMLNIPASEVVNQSYGSYKGYVAEHFVADELKRSVLGPLYTWKGNTSEVEFLLTWHGNVVPIEVKSGVHTRRSKSLKVFCEKYHPHIAVKMSGRTFSIDRRDNDRTKQCTTLNVPLYAAGDIARILESLD